MNLEKEDWVVFSSCGLLTHLREPNLRIHFFLFTPIPPLSRRLGRRRRVRECCEWLLRVREEEKTEEDRVP